MAYSRKARESRGGSSLAAPSSPIASVKRGFGSPRPAPRIAEHLQYDGEDGIAADLEASTEKGRLFSPQLKWNAGEEDELGSCGGSGDIDIDAAASGSHAGGCGNENVPPSEALAAARRALEAADAAARREDAENDSKMAMVHDDDDAQSEEPDFNPFCFIKALPPYGEVIANRIVPTLLPKRTRRSHPMTLVLDLDETLVHCSIEPITDADIQFNVDFSGLVYQVFVRKRPYLHHFLQAVSKKFEVIVFTASQKVYAEKLLNLLDPHRQLIKYRLYRDSCLEVCDNFLKDLNVLGRDLKSTIIVDNSPHAFGYQVSNGIPIESWFDDKNDTELLKLLPVLESLRTKEDVRPHIREYYQLHKAIADAR